MLIEQLLDLLCLESPETISIFTSLLQGFGDSDAKPWMNALSSRLGPLREYKGDVMYDSREVSVDVLILTVKENEFRATLAAFGVSAGEKPILVARDCEVWLAENSGVTYAIAIIGTDGNVESAIATGKLWAFVKFRAAVMLGMAAGVKDKVRLGDVVVGTSVVAYEFQRMTSDGPVYQPKVYSPPSRLTQRLPTMGQMMPDWPAKVAAELGQCSQFEGIERTEPEKINRRWKPKIKTGVILAGSKLIEDGSLPRMEHDLHGRVLAAEMEGAGFAAVCEHEDVTWLVVRGVADYGEANRRKSWQWPASYVAACLVRDCIPQGRLPLLSDS
jgi:nucleoside phosphorylase